MRAVTYGPFPGGWPRDFSKDFEEISKAGFNAVRLYSLPSRHLLDAASAHRLKVFGGLAWGQHADFLENTSLYASARVALADFLHSSGSHQALAGIYVGNEVPADLAKWMGPLNVRHALEGLIRLGKELAPELLFAYASYPSTEYLEPENADFTALNVYLEDESAFRSYLKRLHHIAGDRPLVISEFGLDSRRNGLHRQAEILTWAAQAARELETAGMTIYAWSDLWWNAGAEVLDWDFGLTDRGHQPKPALAALASLCTQPPTARSDSFSIIVCTRNGRSRIGACLRAIDKSCGATRNDETLVVDDGSDDGTADYVAEHFPWVRLLRLAPSGLSAARNAGAAAASGEIFAFTDDDCIPDREWISRLVRSFSTGEHAAAGGPNLPPPPRYWQEAVVAAAPGAPSHVLLDDEEAEHLPGCNLAVTRSAFEAIGGFDPQFRTAGDDVDFCWRLRDAGYRLGFVPGAFVWHARRPTLAGYLRQQLGYGRAERLLLAKHPTRFSKDGGAKWQGFVYGGGSVRVMADSIIYHGPLGDAAYQVIHNRMLPLRGLAPRFDTALVRFHLRWVSFFQPQLRAWARNRRLVIPSLPPRRVITTEASQEYTLTATREAVLQFLLAQGWQSAEADSIWDLEKTGSHLQLATEKGDQLPDRTLIRLWGTQQVDFSALPACV
jgi:GT2 family glycosyltransferase